MTDILPVVHDTEKQRFVICVDGVEVETLYRMFDEKTIEFYHTMTPHELRGKGYARAVVDAGLDYASASGLDVVATCSYVEKILTRRNSQA